jgi:hypothetical protein
MRNENFPCFNLKHKQIKHGFFAAKISLELTWNIQRLNLECSLFKNRSFYTDDQKVLNTLAVHIEGIRHPSICLFGTLFSCQCPFKFEK